MAVMEGRIFVSAKRASEAIDDMLNKVKSTSQPEVVPDPTKKIFTGEESSGEALWDENKAADERRSEEAVLTEAEPKEGDEWEGDDDFESPDDGEPDGFESPDDEPDGDGSDTVKPVAPVANDNNSEEELPVPNDNTERERIKSPHIHIPRPSSRPESLKGFVDAQGNKHEFAKPSSRPESLKGFVDANGNKYEFAKPSERPENSNSFAESANEGEFVNESADNEAEEIYQKKEKPENKYNGTVQVHPNNGKKESKETNGIFTVEKYEAPDSSVDFMYKDGKTPAELEKIKRLSAWPWQNYDRVVRRRKYRNFQELMFAEFKGNNADLTNKQIMNNITRVIFKDTSVNMISDTFKKSVSLPITAMMDFYGFFDFKTFLTKTYTNLMYIELATEDIANRCFRSLGSLDSIWKYQPRLQILVVVGKKVTRDDESRQSLLLDDLTRYNKLQQAKDEFNSRLLKQKGIKNTVRNRATLARYRQDAGASGYRSSNKALNTVGRRGFIGGVLNIGFGVAGFVGGIIGRITGNYY